jgi:sodium-dependent phosphate cotransporter
MRWPIVACKILGRTTANYRWFAVMYLIMAFFIVPGAILSLSLAGNTAFLLIGTPVFLVMVPSK